MEEREKIKQELMEELKKEYQLVPIKDARFVVSDILGRYMSQICKKLNIENNWSSKQSIENAIRKVVAMHLGCFSTKDLKKEQRNEYRNQMENFIKDYILKNE